MAFSSLPNQECYYIKSDGEVDLAVISGKSFMPIEIKNSFILKENELKQILKYKRGFIGYKGLEIGELKQLKVLPLPILAYLAG